MQSLRVAVEGCGHGTLHAVYASVAKACEKRGWDGVDLLIIGGDFQAVRNASDLTVMACPVKYRKIGDFHSYYSGARKAPYLTLFVGGNHEASNHLWELFYGGWVAPNIYYMGAANVLRLGGVRIAGMSGIWKGYNFRKSHYERLPYNEDDIRSIYHVREIDTRKLLQIRTEVDIGLSHDWPKGIELYGDTKSLFKNKPDFQEESRNGIFGNEAARLVMDRLRPPYWFSAHMHCRYAATRVYDALYSRASKKNPPLSPSKTETVSIEIPKNPDEIDLDAEITDETSTNSIQSNKALHLDSNEEKSDDKDAGVSSVPQDHRAQLPNAFSRSPTNVLPPTEITNNIVRFLSLDKCLPGRKFLQLLTVAPQTPPMPNIPKQQKLKLEYDPEWLAITRTFDSNIILGDKSAQTPPDLGEAHYLPIIEKEREWIEENVVKSGRLEIPDNFEITAPPYKVGTPEIVKKGPREYNNPQTQQFCDLIGIQNKFHSTAADQNERFRNGPAAVEERWIKGSHSSDGKSRGANFGSNRHSSRGNRRGRKP
ncbi:Lariat debranching enzyme [Golovinomyces cichoracearum]|uniref:Lariat debranching enzyme n=1 Tax=Golovinomyces cichoracearum TaxID=62708 RepID=A0A420JA57_9PEZI|nr:Lariat debranching enzyme [Golovinomyces cichoracearum]